MALTWDDSFLLGITDIDEQHRTIIEQFTSFSEAIQSGTAKEKLHDTAHFLVKYAGEHFALEETYMERYDYPKIAEQRREHQEFSSYAVELLQKVEEDGASRELALALSGKMIRWVIQHIRNYDHEMGDYVRERMKAEH